MPHPIDIHVGKQLRKIRLIRGLKQSEIATSLNLSFQQIQKYETGANRLSASRMYEISQILEVEPTAFFEDACTKGNKKVTPDISSKISDILAEIMERVNIIDDLNKI